MGEYPVVLADPPWSFRDQGSRIAPSHGGKHYRVLPLREITGVASWVRQAAAPDAFLFLWAPAAMVLGGQAMEVCHAWGFAAKQIIPWVKLTAAGKPAIGMGHYTRCCTEFLVLARRGKAQVSVRNVPGVIHARRGRHSAKPDESYQLIEKLHPGPYLELYARRRYSPAWTAWGHQLQTDERLTA